MKLTNQEYKELIGELEMYKQERDELIDAINEALDYIPDKGNYILIGKQGTLLYEALTECEESRKILLKAIGAE